jgi:hypothetical protein
MARSDGISVGTSCGEDVLYVMPRFNFLRLASTKFTSRIDSGRWLNSGLCLPLMQRMFIYELGL